MTDINRLFITEGTSLRDAIAVIDRGAAQLALVLDATQRLVGTVTDGDIRRGLLRGLGLEAPAAEVMRRNFRYVSATATEADAMQLMRRDSLLQVPALDEQGRVVRLFLLEGLLKPQRRPNIVVLMAGGKGERLRPLTQNCPKPMLPVGGKPMLEIILQQCIDAGFGRFYLSVNYLKQQIMDYFEDGRRWGVDIRYLEEEQPLGTGGALSLLPEAPSDPVLLMNGDVLTRVDFGQLMSFHQEHAAEVTLCVREHVTQIPYGVVEIDNSDVTGFQEKPALTHFVNAGIYVLEPRALQRLATGAHCDMPQLLERVMQAGERVSAFPIHEYWLDIGHPETLNRAHGEWS